MTLDVFRGRKTTTQQLCRWFTRTENDLISLCGVTTKLDVNLMQRHWLWWHIKRHIQKSLTVLLIRILAYRICIRPLGWGIFHILTGYFILILSVNSYNWFHNYNYSLHIYLIFIILFHHIFLLHLTYLALLYSVTYTTREACYSICMCSVLKSYVSVYMLALGIYIYIYLYSVRARISQGRVCEALGQ